MNSDGIAGLIEAIRRLAPEGILGTAACVFFVGGTYLRDRRVWSVATIGVLMLAALVLWIGPPPVAGSENGAWAWDTLTAWVRVVVLLAAIVLVLLSWSSVPDAHAADYYACLLAAVAGVSLSGAGSDLVTLFLALELVSIPTYVLLYLPRHDPAAQEAALKYFLLSVFSSAFLLFGFGYLYGVGGTTRLAGVWEALRQAWTAGWSGSSAGGAAFVLIGLVMVTAGLCFRITAVPFHFYAPDVYQGTPTVVAALLAFLPKVTGFVAFIRVFGFLAPNGATRTGELLLLLWILSAATMTTGNVLALLQSNVKRLLAYSSVAHSGYLLIGLTVACDRGGAADLTSRQEGVTALLFYLVAYAAMTLGAFGVLAYLSSGGRSVENEDDLGGLSRTHPGLALLMALFLFSLIGIPFTSGFWGKLFLFSGLFWGALGASTDRAPLFFWLALIGALNAAVGAWYYLRILAKMYLHSPVKPLPQPRDRPGLVALWLCALVTLIPGLYPAALWKTAERATGSLPAGAPAQLGAKPPEPAHALRIR